MFNQHPDFSEGIEIELKYNNGTAVTEKVAASENGYSVNEKTLFVAKHTDVIDYSLKSEGLCLNEGVI